MFTEKPNTSHIAREALLASSGLKAKFLPNGTRLWLYTVNPLCATGKEILLFLKLAKLVSHVIAFAYVFFFSWWITHLLLFFRHFLFLDLLILIALPLLRLFSLFSVNILYSSSSNILECTFMHLISTVGTKDSYKNVFC